MALLAVCGFAFATGQEESTSDTEEVTIRLNQFQGGRVEWFEKFADRYTEEVNPNVEVITERVGGENYWPTLRTVFASGDIHDIVTVRPWSVLKDFVDSGDTMDLTGLPILDRFPEGAFQGIVFDGRTYAIPHEIQAMGVVYNRQIFEDLEIEIPRTISELKNVVATLNEAGITPFAVAYNDAWTLRHLFAQGHTPTVDIWEFVQGMNSGEITTFRSPEMERVFDVFDLMNENTFENPFDYDFQRAGAAMAQGEAAMLIQGQWAANQIWPVDPDFRLGMFGLPISDDPGDAKILAGVANAFFIYEESPYKEEAIDFLEWFLQPEVQTEWSELNAALVSVQGVQPPESLNELGQDISSYIDSGHIAPWGWQVWPTGYDVPVQQAMQIYFQDGDRDQFFETIDEAYQDFQ